jgi:hypothetical protein
MINRLVAVLSIGYSIFLFSTGDSTSALAKSAALILFGAAVLISELPLPKFNFKRTRKEPEEMTVEKWQTEEEEDVTQADYRAICYLLQRAGNIGCPDSVTLIQQVQANFFKKMSEGVLPSRPVNTTVSAPPAQSQTKRK